MLGARLETYINKATLDTIRLCLRKLPVELFCKVVEEIQSDSDSYYEENLEWWQAAHKCCQNNCECDKKSGEHWVRQQRLMGKIGQGCPVIDFDKCLQVRVLANL